MFIKLHKIFSKIDFLKCFEVQNDVRKDVNKHRQYKALQESLFSGFFDYDVKTIKVCIMGG